MICFIFELTDISSGNNLYDFAWLFSMHFSSARLVLLSTFDLFFVIGYFICDFVFEFDIYLFGLRRLIKRSNENQLNCIER